MILLQCKNHELTNCCGGEYVPREVHEVTCSGCLIKAATQLEADKKAKVESLKTTQSDVPVFKRKRWTPNEEQVIHDFVKELTIPELMEKLPGRTAYAVESRIWHLKLEHVAKQKYVDEV